MSLSDDVLLLMVGVSLLFLSRLKNSIFFLHNDKFLFLTANLLLSRDTVTSSQSNEQKGHTILHDVFVINDIFNILHYINVTLYIKGIKYQTKVP